MIYDKEFIINFNVKGSIEYVAKGSNSQNRLKNMRVGNSRGYSHSVNVINLGYRFYNGEHKEETYKKPSTCLQYEYENFDINGLHHNTRVLLENLRDCTNKSRIIISAHGGSGLPNAVTSGVLRLPWTGKRVQYYYHLSFISELLSHFLSQSQGIRGAGGGGNSRALVIELMTCHSFSSGFAKNLLNALKDKVLGSRFVVAGYSNTVTEYGRLGYKAKMFQPIPAKHDYKKVLYSWNPEVNPVSFKAYKRQLPQENQIPAIASTTIMAAKSYLIHHNYIVAKPHGVTGQYRVSRLKELISREPTIENTTKKIREFFTRNLSGEDGKIIGSYSGINTNQHSFISYLLNMMKINADEISGNYTEFISCSKADIAYNTLNTVALQLLDKYANLYDFTLNTREVNNARKSLKTILTSSR
jgi:hypothetical protein